MKNKKKNIKIILVFILVVFFVVFFIKKNHTVKNLIINPSLLPPAVQVATYEAINGQKVESSVAQIRPIAVMVENYPAARPQSGLVDADMVYETVTEGGITRFMAVF